MDEVDDEGEPVVQLASSAYKSKSMAKSATQRKREKEIKQKLEEAIRDKVRETMKRKLSKGKVGRIN